MENKHVLILIDVFSKWPEVYETIKMDEFKVIEKLKKIFSRFGLPNIIVSVNGRHFKTVELVDLCRQNGIKFYTPSTFHPKTNDMAENAVRCLKVGIQNAFKNKKNITNFTNKLLFVNVS